RDHFAVARMLPFPEEVANAALYSNTRKSFAHQPIVMYYPRALVNEHSLAELIQALAPGEPAGWYDHRQIARFELLGLFYEQVVNRCCACAVPATAIRQLIWWVTDDHVKLHIASKKLG